MKNIFNKKQIIYLSIAVAGFLVLITGVSYAFFAGKLINNESTSALRAGTIDLLVSDSLINPTKLFPIKDEDVETSDYSYKHTFTVSKSASSDFDVCYNINLIIDSIGNAYSKADIMYKIVGDSHVVSTGNLSGVQNGDRIPILYSQFMDKEYGSSKTYTIYIWYHYDLIEEQEFNSSGSKTLTAHLSATGTIGSCQTSANAISNIKIYGNSVQNGTPSPSNPIEIQSVGDKTKNLFTTGRESVGYTGTTGDGWTLNQLNSLGYSFENNNKTLIFSFLDSNSFIITSVGNGCGLEFAFSCLPNTNYTVSKMSTPVGDNDLRKERTVIYHYDSSGKKMAQELNYHYNDTFTFTTPSDANFFVIKFRPDSDAIISDVQIEQASSATSFEPYGFKTSLTDGVNTTNIYLDEPLRKVEKYADYIDFQKGKVIRQIGKIVLNGSESGWYREETTTSGEYYFYNEILSSLVLKPSSNEEIALVLSDKFSAITSANIDLGNYGVAFDTNGVLKIYYDSAKSYTVEDFVSWLSSNNIVIYYVLETPTEEIIDLPTLLTDATTNIYYAETSIAPSMINIEYIK